MAIRRRTFDYRDVDPFGTTSRPKSNHTTNMSFDEMINSLPQLSQSEYCTIDQLRRLHTIANKFGLHDAANTLSFVLKDE